MFRKGQIKDCELVDSYSRVICGNSVSATWQASHVGGERDNVLNGSDSLPNTWGHSDGERLTERWRQDSEDVRIIL